VVKLHTKRSDSLASLRAKGVREVTLAGRRPVSRIRRPALARGLSTRVKVIWTALALCAAPSAQIWAQPASCPPSIKREMAGEKFPWVGGKEPGIRPTGFVDVPGTAVVHGVDLSGDRDHALLGEAWACGGRFAYVLMSSGEEDQNEKGNFTNWRRARNEGFHIGPMHQLLLLPSKRPFNELSEQDITTLTADNDAYARRQAHLLMQNWFAIMISQDNRREEPSTQNAGGTGCHPKDSSERRKHFLPPALQVTQRLMVSGSSVPETAGTFCRSAICSWLDEGGNYAQGVLRDRRFVLATTPALYKDFHFDKLECGRTSSIALWAIHSPKNGSPPTAWSASKDPTPDPSTAVMCAADGRCIFDRYTPYGSVFTVDVSALYLDRFRGDECSLEDLEAILPPNSEQMLRHLIKIGGL